MCNAINQFNRSVTILYLIPFSIQLQPSPGKVLFSQPVHSSSSSLLPTLPSLTNTTTVYVQRELLELGEELGHGVFGSVLSGMYRTPERKVGISSVLFAVLYM